MLNILWAAVAGIAAVLILVTVTVLTILILFGIVADDKYRH